MAGLTHNFTPEKLEKYSYEDLVSIRARTLEKGLYPDLVTMCDVELAKRPPPPPPRKTKAYPIRQLEKNVCKQLEKLANKLSVKYDLSPETARTLSEGTKGFVPLELLSPNGTPKTGDGQRGGHVAIDRYISFKIGDELAALVAIIENDVDPSEIKFQVLAPEKYIQGYKPISQLRTYLDEGEELGSAKGGIEFDSFEKGAELFSLVMDSIVPKLTQK